MALSSSRRRWSQSQPLWTDSRVGAFLVAALGLTFLMLGLLALLFRSALWPALVALLCFVVATAIAMRALHRHYPHPKLGVANVITLGRLALTCVLVAPLIAGVGASWILFSLALVALMLDGADGWFARRQGLVSVFGARFDMEADAVLALVLACSAAVASGLGVFAIVLGLPRYLFAAAAWHWSWMRADLPERFSRKLVCVFQLGTLIALQAPILPDNLAWLAIALAGAALAWSFAVDVRWLHRQRA